VSKQIPKSYLSVEQFLSLAIRFEVESAEYYHLMQKSAADRKVLELLQDLEHQEMEHERVLKEYRKDHPSKQVMQFAPELGLAMPAAPATPSLDKLFAVAIERERQSARIYKAASDLSSGELRKILDELAGFERQHEERLASIRPSPGAAGAGG